MNLKKSIAIGLIATAAFASFGCGDGGKQGGSSPSQSTAVQQKKDIDEATIKAIVKKMESSNIAEKKEVSPFEKLPGIAVFKTPLLDIQTRWQNEYYNRVVKCDNLSVAEIKQDGDFASAKISYVTAEKQPNTENLYFRRMDGKWYLDAFGFKTVKPLKATGSDERLEAAVNLAYTYENEPVIYLDVRSKTSTHYRTGWRDSASFTLITDAGEFLTQNVGDYTGPVRPLEISSAEATRFCLPFKGATGKPQAIRAVGFNEIDSRGFSVGNNDDQVVTFTLSE